MGTLHGDFHTSCIYLHIFKNMVFKKVMVLIFKKRMFYTSMNIETQDYNKEAAMLAIIFFCYENNILLLFEQFVQILSFVHFFLISYSEIVKS